MAVDSYTFSPEVDQIQEFIEIAGDFSNPLDLVREAISNSFDAKASTMAVSFDVVKEYGESVLVITIEDDGIGMDDTRIRAFFDLGNSTNRGNTETIGEKGHGTKVYFNSSQVRVETTFGGRTLVAVMSEPYRKLFNRERPVVTIERSDTAERPCGTIIQIKGYNNNRRERFTHEILRDYINWFTKLGSFELLLDREAHKDFVLKLKGLVLSCISQRNNVWER